MLGKLLFLSNITNRALLTRKSIRKIPCLNYLQSVKKYCTADGDDDENKANKPAQKDFRHSYAEEVEGEVNSQILAEMSASFFYLSMSVYYGRTDVAMPGCQFFFKHMYKSEQKHALEFVNYQLMRGGIVKLFPITTPENYEWHDITICLALCLEMEKRIKEKLEKLACLAEEQGDLHLLDLLTSNFIPEQNQSIWEFGRFLTRSKRMVLTGGGVGRHLFDKEIFEYTKEKNPHWHLDLYV